jgi:hypothetical protein
MLPTSAMSATGSFSESDGHKPRQRALDALHVLGEDKNALDAATFNVPLIVSKISSMTGRLRWTPEIASERCDWIATLKVTANLRASCLQIGEAAIGPKWTILDLRQHHTAKRLLPYT